MGQTVKAAIGVAGGILVACLVLFGVWQGHRKWKADNCWAKTQKILEMTEEIAAPSKTLEDAEQKKSRLDRLELERQEACR